MADQVHLWEKETQRIQSDDVMVYENFENEVLFIKVLEFARNSRLVIWEDRDKQIIITKQSGG